MQTFINLLLFCAGLGVFLYGMRVISENLERSAGKKMQNLFDKVTNNKLLGVGIGFGTTAIIQSSSATTVMILGFVNAGLMTLYQATTLIMGANIGTTMTAVLVSLQSLPIGPIFMSLVLIGAFTMMFSKKDKAKLAGGIMVGLGLLFVGLDIMSTNMAFLKETPAVINLFNSLTNPFLLLLIGAVFTAIIQSSSASTSIVITLVLTQVMPINSALYVILGTNLGTCITAFLAVIGASTNALRTAFIHLMFNVIGVVIFFPILLIAEKPIVSALGFIKNPAMAIAFFHVIFNVSTTIILLPFTTQFVHAIEKLIPDKKKRTATPQPIYHLDYIDDRFVSSPSVAINQLIKEIKGMNGLAKENLALSLDGLCHKDLGQKDKILYNEERIDFLTKSITDFAIKISGQRLTERDENVISSIYHIVTDIERIGDHAKNFLDYTNELTVKNLSFSDVAIEDIRKIEDVVFKMIDICEKFFTTQDLSLYDQLFVLEEEVDVLKDTLTEGHINRLNAKKCTVDTGAIFFGVLTDLERVGDHITNICSSIHPSVLNRRKKIRTTLSKDNKPIDKMSV